MLNNKQEAWKEPEKELAFVEHVDGWEDDDELNINDM